MAKTGDQPVPQDETFRKYAQAFGKKLVIPIV